MKASEKSMKLGGGGNAFDWFVLSLALTKLGDPDRAKKHYEQAVNWMEEHDPKNEELMSFRAEAKQLRQDR